jgi:sialic acid synthase SpsE
MNWLKRYTPSVGFSDHILGHDLAKVAMVMGAEYIEKHFTIDKNLPGKDQAISAEPDIIREIVKYAEYVEKVTGKAVYEPSPEEKRTREQYVGKWGDNR